MSTSDTAATDPGSFSPDGEFDEWDDTPITPRARMPWVTKLLAILAVAALAFTGGIYAHKQWGTSSASASTGAAAFGAARRAGGFSGFRGFGSGAGAAGAGLSPVASGQVSYIKGTTLYVADLTGSTIKVVTSGARVTKTSTLTAGAIHPGDTVVVIGSKGANGTIAATSITVGGGIGAILGNG